MIGSHFTITLRRKPMFDNGDCMPPFTIYLESEYLYIYIWASINTVFCLNMQDPKKEGFLKFSVSYTVLLYLLFPDIFFILSTQYNIKVGFLFTIFRQTLMVNSHLSLHYSLGSKPYIRGRRWCCIFNNIEENLQ